MSSLCYSSLGMHVSNFVSIILLFPICLYYMQCWPTFTQHCLLPTSVSIIIDTSVSVLKPGHESTQTS